MAGRFQDRVVVMIGASAGIGGSASRMFAAQGARVVLVARGLDALEHVATQIRDAGGIAHVISADVSNLDRCEELIQEAVDTFGGIDVLVNNAAVHHRGVFERHDAWRFAQMVDVNLRAPIVLSRLALPHLKRSSRGCIVNVASLAGCLPLPQAVVYSSTKFGLRAFSLAMSEELRATNVSVALVSPGPVDTDFIMDHLDEVAPITFSQPLSTADEIAEMILDAAEDGLPERKRPAVGGALATLAYLAPALGRTLRPVLEERGRRQIEMLRARKAKK